VREWFAFPDIASCLVVGCLASFTACAAGPTTVRPGHNVRIQDVEGDTLIGSVLQAKSDTVSIYDALGDTLHVPTASIGVIEVDSHDSRPWVKPVACVTGGLAVVLLGVDVAQWDFEWRDVFQPLIAGQLVWICLEEGPDWKAGRIP
jgi:hypothetical protein